MRYYQTLDHPHIVYRLYNAAGELLYVGLTRKFGLRFEQHTTRCWWHEVTSIKVEHHQNALSARQAESAAIVLEKPRYNLIAGDDVELGVEPPSPARGDGVHCPRCTAIKENPKLAYCKNCTRDYQRERRRAAGVKPIPAPTTICPKCGGPKAPGPNYCKPCKRAYDAEYRRTH